MSAVPLLVLLIHICTIIDTVSHNCVWLLPLYLTVTTYTPDHPLRLVKALNKPLHSCCALTELPLGRKLATQILPLDWAISVRRRPLWKMAASPKPTKGSHADRWIITGRPQEYSAHYVCNPPSVLLCHTCTILHTVTCNCLMATILEFCHLHTRPPTKIGKNT